jgi:hypothetical protein
MNTKIALVLRTAAVLGLAFAAGCESTPARQPRHTLTVVLSPNTVTPPVEIGLVSAVKVVIPGPDPGSGLVWEIASNNTSVLEQTAPLAMDPGTGGAGPTTSASFYSLRPGKSILRFFLLRPTETEAIPAAKCEVTVRVSE